MCKCHKMKFTAPLKVHYGGRLNIDIPVILNIK